MSGPTGLPDPIGATVVQVTSAQQMADAVLASLTGTDALIMAAAVADFRPARTSGSKIKKSGAEALTIETRRTTDILATVAKQRAETGSPCVVVGFAAESDDLATNAEEKLDRKGMDLVVANDITAQDAGFAGDTNRVLIIESGGARQQLDTMTKAAVAEIVLDRVATHLAR